MGTFSLEKSEVESAFEFPEIGALAPDDARQALRSPAARHGVAYTDEAVDEILVQTQAYPYFLQEWGKHWWHCAPASPITRTVVDCASDIAIAELDASFFRVRFDRLTPSEKRYLRAPG